MSSSLRTSRRRGGEINGLALPKGKKLTCELCNKPAEVQCVSCRVTCYCSPLHQETDWVGIHSKICPLLGALRTPPGFLGSEEERSARAREEEALKHELLAVTRREGHRLLYEGHHEVAMPAALHSLRFAIDLYGPDNIELVPSYLLLGEASIGLERFKQVEEYLSLARWAVLKSPDCPKTIRAQLYHNFGLLYAAQGKHQDALEQLAKDVYYSALVYGPEHINTTGGYFQLGNVFYAQKNDPAMLAMYEQVTAIWRTYLTAAVNDPSFAAANPLDVAKEAEAMQMLLRIASVREEVLGSQAVEYGELNFVIAMLFHLLGALPKAQSFATTALGIYHAQEKVDLQTVDEIESLIGIIDDELAR